MAEVAAQLGLVRKAVIPSESHSDPLPTRLLVARPGDKEDL
ncbi:MAG TPA: hypothetical protein VIL84_01190 [Devosiaceae bacterium]